LSVDIKETPIDVAPKSSPLQLNDNYRNDTFPNEKGNQLTAPQRRNHNNNDTTTTTNDATESATVTEI